MGPSGPTGAFTIAVAPLPAGQCLYAFDTCTNQVSPITCARQPAPALALAPGPLAVALAVLSLMGLTGLWRIRRLP
ncbi:MAG: hypothetical protein ACRERC_17080 [Candidatus Binatia bacterium]